MKKRILTFILASALLLSFASCSKENAEDTDKPTESVSEETEKNEESVSVNGILLSGKTPYRIVFTEGNKGYANKILDKLIALDSVNAQKVGFYKTVLDTATADDGSPEILIGLTNREASAKAKSELPTYLDYSITVSENKITIFANTEDRLEEAVNQFISLIKKEQDSYVIYSGESSIINSHGKYLFETLKISEDDIKDYSIILPSEPTNSDKSFALALQSWVAESIGFEPNLSSDSQAETEKEILIGATSRALDSSITSEITSVENDNFYFKQSGKKLILSAKTDSGYKKLFNALKSQFAKNSGVLPQDTSLTQTVSLDGTKAIFIGNSYIYYGNCVIYGNETQSDIGYFHQICKANGDDVTVYDYTFGGKDAKWIYDNHLANTTEEFRNSIDYVFISESIRNTADVVERVNLVGDLFPNAKKKIFLNHASSAQGNEAQVVSGLEALAAEGYLIANWGSLVYDVWRGALKVPNATCSYDKNSFIVNKEDTHHQNLLSGYITSQMAYCVVSGASALGQDYSFCGDSGINLRFGFEKFKQDFYNPNSTNFDKIFNSPADMQGLQALMDQYIAKYN